MFENIPNCSQLNNESKIQSIHYPQKRFYRQRAHSNPMSDHDLVYPLSPEKYFFRVKIFKKFFLRMDWSQLFSSSSSNSLPQFADIGCGYGGLLVRLSPMFPDIMMVGMEIRVKVSDFVQDRIKALIEQNPSKYGNICCVRSNAMKNITNFFFKGQLDKMFFLFPDPHFKKTKHKWRIISTNLLSEYAYVLRPGGRIYTITDVEEVHKWMVDQIGQHPLFKRLEKEEEEKDEIVPLLYDSTEEGQKVTRNSGQKWLALFRRLKNP
ncbi:unnamed protein product [Meloidogyne enterolobii]|uniref:Uncharacterized protein n=1 Tax=Meloidogyne enterolobii TaxID=390850 RepID=A0ACB0ZNK7_MELEN